LKKLIIDIKDGYAAIAGSDDENVRYYKIDFSEDDFASKPENDMPIQTIIDFCNTELVDFISQAEDIVLSVPIRFSLIKTIALDLKGIEKYGDSFLSWESAMQLPDDLGSFIHGFDKLGENYDSSFHNYLYYASPEEMISVLRDFVQPESAARLTMASEAQGLYQFLNSAHADAGFYSAVSIEHDGAAIINTLDGMFLSGKFIKSDNKRILDEIMYYIMPHCPDSLQPHLMICGDPGNIDLSSLQNWADVIKVTDDNYKSSQPDFTNHGVYNAVSGLLLYS